MINLEKLKQELGFKTARSSGAGGQNVNKVETKVELRFDVVNSRHLDVAEKQMVLTNLAGRINAEGVLLISCQSSRSQLENKLMAIAEFDKLLTKATTPPKKRKKVKPLVADQQKRLALKKETAEKKASRQKTARQFLSDRQADI